jgi:MFS transporter, Spinster family, sphingosine-1-phosphate transporter
MKAIAYRSYLLSVLTVILAFNLLDRVALDLLAQDIKVDLQLTDTQLGLLTGIAFSLFYSVMGIPIARWADRGNRVSLISITTGLWCTAVTLCAVATNFWQLLLIRVGVAVGEAGCMPPAHSLIADHFSRAERPRAVARYLLGAPLSALVGYFLAGWLNQLYGWRTTFVILGLPGLMVAALAALTLREPRRSGETASASARAEPPRLAEVIGALWGNTTFRQLLFCYAIVCFFGSGKAKWQAAFYIRSFGLETGELGTWFALIFGFGGLLGTYLGGELAASRAANNERLQLRSIAVSYLLCGVLSVGAYSTSDRYISLTCTAVAAIIITIANAPLFATVQTLVPDRMRAMAIAILLLSANLIGLGLGPLAAGMLSDALHPLVGAESLRYALLACCPGYVWAAAHCWSAGRTVQRDVEINETQRPPSKLDAAALADVRQAP